MLEKLKKIIPWKILQPIYHFLMAWLAALIYYFPSNKLIVIGVTGTAGKTSTVYLIAQMLNEAGYKTGFTSTTIFSDGNREWLNNKKMTMPGRFFISKLLARMLKNNCRYAIVETTSEGIKQFRHRFLNYDLLVFTGLYPEHLEAHGGFENYKKAKGKLFAHLQRCRTKYINDERRVVKPSSQFKKLDLHRVVKTIIINGDDQQVDYFLNFWSEAKVVYSTQPQLDDEFFIKKLTADNFVKDFLLVIGKKIEASSTGTTFFINEQKINLKLLGEFNARNALAASAVGLNQGLSLEIIKSSLEAVRSLAGKLELINAGQDFTVIVDYSFEPQALEKLYNLLSLIPHQRIIHLLGSTGGGRDKTRRPLLGKIAGTKADVVIVSNEDPYDEDPMIIINAVAHGAELAGKKLNKTLFKILDRREGIKKALELAKKDDLVLFTGKGAEQFICVANGEKIPWDERTITREEIVDKLCIDKK